MAARLALLRAQRQLYKDAGVNIHVKNFAVRKPPSYSSMSFALDMLSLFDQVINQASFIPWHNLMHN